jgi:hypothetical protein
MAGRQRRKPVSKTQRLYRQSSIRRSRAAIERLVFDPAGGLALAQHGDRRIVRLERSGRKTTLVQSKRILCHNAGI